MAPQRFLPRIRPAPAGRPQTIGQVQGQAMPGGNYGGISGDALSAIGRAQALQGGIKTLLGLGGHDYYNDVHAEQRQDALIAAHTERERDRLAAAKQEREQAQREQDAREKDRETHADARAAGRNEHADARHAADRQAEADRQARGITARRDDAAAAEARRLARPQTPAQKERDAFEKYNAFEEDKSKAAVLPFGIGTAMRGAGTPAGQDPTFGSKQAFNEQARLRGEAVKGEQAATREADKKDAATRQGSVEAGRAARAKEIDDRYKDRMRRIDQATAERKLTAPAAAYARLVEEFARDNAKSLTPKTQDEVEALAKDTWKRAHGGGDPPEIPSVLPRVREDAMPAEAPAKGLLQAVQEGAAKAAGQTAPPLVRPGALPQSAPEATPQPVPMPGPASPALEPEALAMRLRARMVARQPAPAPAPTPAAPTPQGVMQPADPIMADPSSGPGPGPSPFVPPPNDGLGGAMTDPTMAQSFMPKPQVPPPAPPPPPAPMPFKGVTGGMQTAPGVIQPPQPPGLLDTLAGTPRALMNAAKDAIDPPQPPVVETPAPRIFDWTKGITPDRANKAVFGPSLAGLAEPDRVDGDDPDDRRRALEAQSKQEEAQRHAADRSQADEAWAAEAAAAQEQENAQRAARWRKDGMGDATTDPIAAAPHPDPRANALVDMVKSGQVSAEDALNHPDVPDDHKDYLQSVLETADPTRAYRGALQQAGLAPRNDDNGDD